MRNRAYGSFRNSERFSSVAPPRVGRSAFDRSHDHKTTIDSGFLYPVWVDELLPGDTISWRPSFFCRMATPLRPWMDGLHLDYQVFVCRTSLLHENFVRMMGEKDAPSDHNDYQVPQVDIPAGSTSGQLWDYFGLPVEVTTELTVCAYWHRMYNLVWNEWYRDENLQDPVTLVLGDGPDPHERYNLLRRGKRKDYFSGALPFAQKGTAVQLPLGTDAPVTISTDGNPLEFVGSVSGRTGELEPNQALTPTSPVDITQQTPSGAWLAGESLAITGTGLSGSVDLEQATAATINELRQAISLQHLFERDARGGTRYRELNLAHFGVVSDDQRLDRPQVVATGSVAITPNQVAQQSAGTGDLGDLGAFGTGASVGRGFTYSATEHMCCMALVSVRADLSYQRGIERMFSRKSRFDFFFPDLQATGEQAVLSKEMWADGTGDEVAGTGDWSVWGYQPRFEEYRHRQSKITGEFRSEHPQSLDIWHLAQDFATRPALNAAFIEENPPVSRIVAVPSEPEFLLDCHFKVRHVRPMAKFGTPGLSRF